MKLTYRFGIATACAVTVVGMTVAGTGLAATHASARPVAAHALRARPHRNVAGDWHYRMRFAHSRSVWDIEVKANRLGRLKGTVEPTHTDCHGRLTGTVKGNVINMTWQIHAPCPSQMVSVKGTAAHGKISGTFVDSKLGSGRFVASRDR